jgi:hypothetical protein
MCDGHVVYQAVFQFIKQWWSFSKMQVEISKPCMQKVLL